MIPALVALRYAIDRALEALGPLVPVVAAWQATQEPAQEPADAPERAQTGGERLSETHPAPAGNGADPGEQAVCRYMPCGKPLPSRGGRPGPRLKYCSENCRVAAAQARARARAATEAAAEPVPDLLERPLRVPEHEGSSDTSALAPPRLPWESDEARH